MIKIYSDHEGGTKMMGRINEGAELIIHNVLGAIQYKGPGVFIAGGAGVTPFISIFRNLYKNNKIAGNRLFYSNKTSADVIIEEELQKMLKNDFVKLFTRENIGGYIARSIDRNFLIENITDFEQYFYVCGPEEFVESITAHLYELGATAKNVVFEK